jgi:hypothetical protein
MGNSPDIFDVAFNTLAGTVWQWIYTAMSEEENDFLMAGTLATSVMSATLFMALFGWFINGYTDFAARQRLASRDNRVAIEIETPSLIEQSIFRPPSRTSLLEDELVEDQEDNRIRRLTV